ncbi:MAG: zinc ribbon domain-containing protein [Vicinamibacteria bacterium]
MMAELENLVRLQKLDDEIRALETRLRAIPKEIEALEKEIATERKNLDDAQKAYADAQKAHRANESELQATEEKVKKYKDQLMNVKTNDEYRLMQKQIEVALKDVSDVEDKILQGYDALKELEERKLERQKELDKGQKEVSGMERELEAERARLDAELATRQTSRNDLLQHIPEELFGDYDRIARVRGGVAMAGAVDERCQVCMVRLRPQVFQELRIGEKIFHCESCRRILYYQQKEEAPAT